MNNHMQELLGVDSKPPTVVTDPYEDLKFLLNFPQGRRVFTKLLIDLGVGAPSWRPNSSIYRQTALKDFGDSILADIAEASEPVYIQLQAEICSYRRKSNV